MKPIPIPIRSINGIAAFCEATGADVREVAKAIGADSRIVPKLLQTGPGFSCSGFQKNILNLVNLCRHYGSEELATNWDSVVMLNYWQQQRIARLVITKLLGALSGKHIAVLSFAFNPDINDTREPSAPLRWAIAVGRRWRICTRRLAVPIPCCCSESGRPLPRSTGRRWRQ